MSRWQGLRRGIPSYMSTHIFHEILNAQKEPWTIIAIIWIIFWKAKKLQNRNYPAQRGPWSSMVSVSDITFTCSRLGLILFNLWYAPWHVVQQSPWFRDSHSQEGFSHCTWSHSTIPSLHLHCLQFSIVIDCPSANEELPISHRNVVAEKR